jgi:hypothetical protein
MSKSRWTSVEQGLPKGRCFCLVAMHIGENEKQRYVRMAHFDPARAAGGGHLFSGDEIDFDLHTITHWMPLPEPPKVN